MFKNDHFFSFNFSYHKQYGFISVNKNFIEANFNDDNTTTIITIIIIITLIQYKIITTISITIIQLRFLLNKNIKLITVPNHC